MCLLKTPEYFHDLIVKLRINGKGKKTPCVSARNAIQLIWDLPGKQAKAFRRTCSHYICRILGGDASLIEEMQTRAAVSTEAQRDLFLGKRSSPTREADEAAAKRQGIDRERQEDLEDRRLKRLRLAAEIQNITADAQKKAADAQKIFLENIEFAMGSNPDGRDKIWMDDLNKRILTENYTSHIKQTALSTSC